MRVSDISTCHSGVWSRTGKELGGLSPVTTFECEAWAGLRTKGVTRAFLHVPSLPGTVPSRIPGTRNHRSHQQSAQMQRPSLAHLRPAPPSSQFRQPSTLMAGEIPGPAQAAAGRSLRGQGPRLFPCRQAHSPCQAPCLVSLSVCSSTAWRLTEPLKARHTVPHPGQPPQRPGQRRPPRP